VNSPAGCQTNISDASDAVRPLHVAVSVYNDVDEFDAILGCLVDGGCELDARALGCETSLYRALDLGKADLATLLLQYGAGVDVECPHGVTILNKVGFFRRITALVVHNPYIPHSLFHSRQQVSAVAD